MGTDRNLGIGSFFVLKGERIAADFKNIVPESFGYASTKSGYIDKGSFLNFLIHFNKHRENKNICLLYTSPSPRD